MSEIISKIKKSVKLRIALAVAAGLLFLILVAGFIPVSLPVLRNQVVAIAEKNLGGPCAVDKMTVRLWSGVSLKGVHVFFVRASGDTVSADVESINLSWSLLPLLFKHVHVKALTIERPAAHIRKAAKPVVTRKVEKDMQKSLQETVEGMPYTFSLKNIRVRRGRFSVLAPSGHVLSAAGIKVDLAVGLKEVIFAGGSCAVDSLRLGPQGTLVSDLFVKTEVRAWEVSVNKISGRFYDGKISGKGAVRLDINRIKDFEFSVTKINLEKYYGSLNLDQGSLRGYADASVSLSPSFLAPDSLRGRGNVLLTSVQAQMTPIQQSIPLKTFVPKLANLEFSRIRCPFIIRNGKIINDNMTGEGNLVDFQSKGWAALDGYLMQNIELILHDDFADALPRVLQYPLITNRKGQRTLLLTLTNTFEEPRIAMDKKALNRTIGRALFDIQKGLQGLFK
jgi:hypothetical protein